MAQPSGHDFSWRMASIGNGKSRGDRAGPFVSSDTADPGEAQIVYNFLYLTGTIHWFFENILCPAVTAMRHGVAERRN